MCVTLFFTYICTSYTSILISLYCIFIYYRSLAKKGPWAVHITLIFVTSCILPRKSAHVYIITTYNRIPYSRKYWRSIKFGGLVVGEATIKFKSVKFKCDLCECVRAYYMYGTTAKFKSANIFISAARDQTAKFKDRQYFRLYGIAHQHTHPVQA